MGTTLDHGIYLPDEGERNCYDGLAGNWVALDNHLGSTNIHVTINDKQAWDGHVADTVKHVTAEDKAKWDAVTGKADDADAVHKSGNETISGNKTFSSNVNVYNSNSTANVPSLVLKNSIAERGVATNTQQTINFTDKNDVSLGYISCGVTASAVAQIAFRLFDTNNQSNGFSIRRTTFATAIQPITDNTVSLGTNAGKWSDVQTYKINDLEPSYLSMPSGNARDFIDISSYFANTSTGDTNSYTAPANGFIYLRLGNISSCQATVYDASSNRMWGQSSTGNVEQITIPILKGQTLTTQWSTSSSVNVATARFIPCQGNI